MLPFCPNSPCNPGGPGGPGAPLSMSHSLGSTVMSRHNIQICINIKLCMKKNVQTMHEEASILGSPGGPGRPGIPGCPGGPNRDSPSIPISPFSPRSPFSPLSPRAPSKCRPEIHKPRRRHGVESWFSLSLIGADSFGRSDFTWWTCFSLWTRKACG